MSVDALGRWVSADSSAAIFTPAEIDRALSTPNASRGKKKKWTPQIGVNADFDEAVSLLKQFGKSASPEIVRKDVLLFLDINRRSTEVFGIEHTLMILLGQWKRFELAPGTCVTYFSYVRALFPASLHYKWMAILKAAHADSEACRPPSDVGEEALLADLQAKANTDALPWLRTFGLLLFVTGARCRDLSRLRRKQIKLSLSKASSKKLTKKLSIQFRLTKNRRNR